MKKIDEKGIRAFIEKHNIKVSKEEEYKGGRKLILEHCVFDEGHDGTSAAIIIKENGGIGYKCQHDSCSKKSIADVLRMYEPDFYKDDPKKKDTSNNTEPIKLKVLSSVEEESIEWLLPRYVPSAQITVICGDGGTGKTAIWCDVVASVTTGKKCIFDEGMSSIDTFGEEYLERSPQNAMFFSSEDSVPKVLIHRLKAAGADLNKVVFLDLTDKNFDRIKFDSAELEELIEEYKPAIVIFDPLQSFIPPNIQMGSRNAMRQCLSPLIGLGEKYGTTFIIIMHTNKKSGVSGRQRLADSADIWDISRSVLIAGMTAEKGIRYLSHEKTNYGTLAQTILYTIDDGGCVKYKGHSEKRDRDYMHDYMSEDRSAPATEEAIECILDYLKDGTSKPVKDVDSIAQAAGITKSALKKAKARLKEEGKIELINEGYGEGGKVYSYRLIKEEPTE